ncbi:hypothetical protein PVAP13_6KG391650 [Panicum virgatum]|uniref:Uncharacterized protein n=1 Tax=Panicum virgatum TaxID=38727 RepID=A0A8T0RKL8_PANVG|nr:hypothetical protein PVAP13_6KG391650 [Panicum virgatum]
MRSCRTYQWVPQRHQPSSPTPLPDEGQGWQEEGLQPCRWWPRREQPHSVRDEPGVPGHHPGERHFFPVKPADYGRFMVISLGCGSNRNRRYCAKAAARWGIFSWLIKGGTAPIVDMFNSASADMVDIHLCVLFRALHSSENYLRIQYDRLTGSAGSVDDSSKENMDRLVRSGRGSWT